MRPLLSKAQGILPSPRAYIKDSPNGTKTLYEGVDNGFLGSGEVVSNIVFLSPDCISFGRTHFDVSVFVPQLKPCSTATCGRHHQNIQTLAEFIAGSNCVVIWSTFYGSIVVSRTSVLRRSPITVLISVEQRCSFDVDSAQGLAGRRSHFTFTELEQFAEPLSCRRY